MKKHFRYGLFFALGAMLALGFVACGDDSSSGPSKNEETGIETEVSSSSEKADASSSSNKKIASTSSSSWQALSSTPRNDKKSSSSVKDEVSSSSAKNKESSSSGKVETSSSKKSSSSSSNPRKDNKSSSSSVKNPEPGEGASSSESSSSGIVTQNSSSSSENLGPIENSSSSEESSSSVIETSSSSLVATGVCKTRVEDNCIYGTLYDDRDGKTYKTVKIGEQEWMAENLNFKVNVIDKTSYGSFCEKDSVLCSRYGRHYTWTAAIDSISLYTQYSIQCGVGKKCSPSVDLKIKGICPDGWHLPNQSEWEKLIAFVGNSDAGKILKSFLYWEQWPGEDSYGFSVLPSGIVTNATIYHQDVKTSLWTSTDHDNFSAQCAQFNYSEVRKDAVMLQSMSKSAVAALPVRCIKN